MHFGHEISHEKIEMRAVLERGQGVSESAAFDLLGREIGKDAAALAREIWIATLLLDKLGLYTVEADQKNREAVKPAAAGRADRAYMCRKLGVYYPARKSPSVLQF